MKIAILLPRWPDLGWIWRVRALVSALPAAAAAAGVDDLQIAVGVHMGEREDAVNEALALRGRDGVVVRTYRWEAVACDKAARMYSQAAFDFSGLETVQVPRDWGWNFCDCDAWIVAPDLQLGAMMLLRPTLLFGRAIEERYDPTFAARHGRLSPLKTQMDSLLSWRQALCVFASHERTLADFASFSGLWSHRTLKIDALAMPALDEDLASILKETGRTDVLCLLDTYDRDGLEALALALRSALGGKSDRVTFAVEGFSRGDGARQRGLLAERLAALDILETSRYRVKSYAGVDDLAHLLYASRLVISTDPAPGEPEDMVWAAAAGCPFIGRKTPQSEAWARERGLQAHLVDDFETSTLRSAIREASEPDAAQIEAAKGASASPASLAAVFDRVREAAYGV
jgi:hypothetical protein